MDRLPTAIVRLSPALWLVGCGLGLESFAPGGPAGGDSGLPTGLDSGGVGPDDGGADSGSDADGGSDGGSDGGTGGAQAPTVGSLNVSEGPGRIEVSFQASDPQDDLDGGRLLLAVDGATQSYNIPGQISDWRPSGASTQYLDLDDCSRGRRMEFSVQLEDALGHKSSAKTDSLTLSGASKALAELGDDETAVENLGTLSRDTFLCGDIYRASNDGSSSYTGDLDLMSFRIDTPGTYSFALTWGAGSGDYDMHLYDTSWNRLAEAVEFGTSQPEQFSYSLVSGTAYVLVVAGWDGGSGAYTVTIR
ncbi:MAG: hypothetical protein H6742_01265 [Alphaproteobacteria bacterium]|nr:hypothetical protein [Alphaproteobacteria bacterium]